MGHPGVSYKTKPQFGTGVSLAGCRANSRAPTAGAASRRGRLAPGRCLPLPLLPPPGLPLPEAPGLKVKINARLRFFFFFFFFYHPSPPLPGGGSTCPFSFVLRRAGRRRAGAAAAAGNRRPEGEERGRDPTAAVSSSCRPALNRKPRSHVFILSYFIFFPPQLEVQTAE